MSEFTLVPSEFKPTSPGVGDMLAAIERANSENRRVYELEKLVGFDREGRPDYPKIRIRAEMGAYGQPVASVSIQRTRTSGHDFIGSLKDLDVRVACEYYLRLDSVEAVDAVEKVLRAPTPKAIALIALLGQLGLGPDLPERRTAQPERIDNNNNQKVIDV